MIIIFLLTFAAIIGLIALCGAKLSKKAREMKMKQDIEIYESIMSARGKNSDNTNNH